MKVSSRNTGETRLVGTCDISEDTVDSYDVPLFRGKSMFMERFGIGYVNLFRLMGTYTTELGVLLVPGQDPELLPAATRILNEP
jgi:hypothetical protein